MTEPIFIGHKSESYVVRLWDMMDGWVGTSKVMTKEGAIEYWNEKTNNGTRNCGGSSRRDY